MGFLKKIRHKKSAREFARVYKKELLKAEKADIRARFAMAFADIKQSKYNDGLRVSTINNMIVVWAYMMNRDYHYGPVRLKRFLDRMADIFEDICKDISPVSEWERALKEEANFTYRHVNMKYFSHDHRIALEQIENMTIAFDCAAFCEFGFCKKRLERCNGAVTDICTGMKKGKYDIQSMEDLLFKKKIFSEEKPKKGAA